MVILWSQYAPAWTVSQVDLMGWRTRRAGIAGELADKRGVMMLLGPKIGLRAAVRHDQRGAALRTSAVCSDGANLVAMLQKSPSARGRIDERFGDVIRYSAASLEEAIGIGVLESTDG